MADEILFMFKNPFSFNGRIRRAEYGISLIIYLIFHTLIKVLIENLPLDLDFETVDFMVILLYSPLLWFLIAQSTKRCHDLGVSGFNQLIPLYIFWLILEKGEGGSNKYDVSSSFSTKIKGFMEKSKSKLHKYLSFTLNKSKQSKIIGKIFTINLSSDEIIIVSVIFGIITALIFGSIFGETIYYHNNGNRGNSDNFDFSEFHLSYIALTVSFIISTGITYILLNRKNGEKL